MGLLIDIDRPYCDGGEGSERHQEMKLMHIAVGLFWNPCRSGIELYSSEGINTLFYSRAFAGGGLDHVIVSKTLELFDLQGRRVVGKVSPSRD